MIILHVPGSPVAQPRAKATTINGYARMYTPTTAGAFKATVAMMAERSHPGPPFDGPVSLQIVFVLDRPKCKIWKRREMPREPHSVKPDADNLTKAVMDALKGIAWRDDAQVAELQVRKVIASGYEQPHTEIMIQSVTISPTERHDEEAREVP
jgi:Holliday junction resolvase RusA-like endonuclease